MLVWELSNEALLSLIHATLDHGITTMDHADIYGVHACEERFGEALAIMPALRERMQIVTKCGIVLPERKDVTVKHYDTSRKHIIQSVEQSLRNLRTDRIDVLLIHRPDALMRAEETASAFHELRSSGKVRYFGVSNFLPSQVALLASRLEVPVVANQVEISVFQKSALHDGTLDHCRQHGITPMAWSPFAGGQLFTGTSSQAKRVRMELLAVGEEIGGAPVDQVALAWLLRHPAGIVPVVGTGKQERIESAAHSVEIELTREQWYRIWVASEGEDVP